MGLQLLLLKTSVFYQHLGPVNLLVITWLVPGAELDIQMNWFFFKPSCVCVETTFDLWLRSNISFIQINKLSD